MLSSILTIFDTIICFSPLYVWCDFDLWINTVHINMYIYIQNIHTFSDKCENRACHSCVCTTHPSMNVCRVQAVGSVYYSPWWSWVSTLHVTTIRLFIMHILFTADEISSTKVYRACTLWSTNKDNACITSPAVNEVHMMWNKSHARCACVYNPYAHIPCVYCLYVCQTSVLWCLCIMCESLLLFMYLRFSFMQL